MKLIGSIIIGVSLVLGLIGAMTAYLPPLTLADEHLLGLELNAKAGVDPADPDAALASRGDIVTPELLEALRAQAVPRINVKEFALVRWTGWPFFLLGAIGMVGGAAMLRQHQAAVLRQEPGAAGGEGAAEAVEAPFEAIRKGARQLRRELPTLPPKDKLHAIIVVFGEAQRTHVPAFVAARPQLVGRLGLARYAQLMDSFAAAERQINRAWSAAADEVLDEALERVEMAAVLLEEAAGKLR